MRWWPDPPFFQPEPERDTLSWGAQQTLGLTLLIALTVAAFRYLGAASFRDRCELGFEAPVVEPRRALAVPRETERRSRLAGAAGVAVYILTYFAYLLAISARGEATLPEVLAFIASHFEEAWMAFIGGVLFWMLGRMAYLSVGGSFSVRALAGREVAIDLLNTKPLFVFGRAALRNALLWIVAPAAFIFFLSNPPSAGPTGGADLLLPAGMLVIPVLALILPTRGVHRRIRAEKRAELERLDAAIHGDARALADTRIADRGKEPSLADLLAYKSQVEAVREWPFDSSTLTRFVLYLLIPLGSWFGGAFVERFVNAILN